MLLLRNTNCNNSFVMQQSISSSSSFFFFFSPALGFCFLEFSWGCSVSFVCKLGEEPPVEEWLRLRPLLLLDASSSGLFNDSYYLCSYHPWSDHPSYIQESIVAALSCDIRVNKLVPHVVTLKQSERMWFWGCLA